MSEKIIDMTGVPRPRESSPLWKALTGTPGPETFIIRLNRHQATVLWDLLSSIDSAAVPGPVTSFVRTLRHQLPTTFLVSAAVPGFEFFKGRLEVSPVPYDIDPLLNNVHPT